MASLLPPRQIETLAAHHSSAEELLAGLLSQPEETGIVGRQLIYLLLSAGLAPARRNRRAPSLPDTTSKPH